MWPAGYPAFGPSGGPAVYVDDLSTGRVTRSQQPAIGAGDYQPLLTQVGPWLVYVGDSGVSAIRDDLTGRPRVLGPTPFFAPAAAPGRVMAVPSSAADLFARTAWSADDSWLLYQGPGGHLWAYQLASRQARASSAPCCQYTVMAAAPSSG